MPGQVVARPAVKGDSEGLEPLELLRSCYSQCYHSKTQKTFLYDDADGCVQTEAVDYRYRHCMRPTDLAIYLALFHFSVCSNPFDSIKFEAAPRYHGHASCPRWHIAVQRFRTLQLRGGVDEDKPARKLRCALFAWESLHSVAEGGVAPHVTELAAGLERLFT